MTDDLGTPSPGRRAPVLLLGALAGAALLYAVLLLGDGVLPRGTVVLGVRIGGLDPGAAATRLEQDLGSRSTDAVQVRAGDRSLQVLPEQAGLSLDVDATLERAQARTLNPLTLLRGWFGTRTVDPVVAVDQAALATAVGSVADQVDVPAREGGVRFEDSGRPVPVQPRVGVVLARSAAAQALRDGYLRPGPVALPVREQQPSVDAAEVQRTLTEVAEPAVSAPVTLLIGSKRVTVSPSLVARTLRFEPTAGGLVPTVDGVALRKALAGRLGGSVVQPRDATFTVKAGKPVVVPAVLGRGVDATGLSTAVLSGMSRSGDRTARVALTPVQPELTTEDARALGVRERISTFTQTFPYAAYRVQNIGQAARRINGTLLLPGQTYSQNATVKERTAANGYTIGTIIVGNKYVEDYGGGVSTITTALWHAAFYAGLERVEQRAHSLYIARYQAGLEATVSWGNLDLRFRNDSPYGVYITAQSGDTWVRVSMYSTKRYTVRAESGPWTDVVQPTTVYDSGANCLAQGGAPGFSIVVTRVFSQGGTVVKREPLRTHYAVHNTIVCGPDPKAKPPPSKKPTPKASAKPTSTARPTAAPRPSPNP